MSNYNNQHGEMARTRNGDKTSMKLLKMPQSSLAINGDGNHADYKFALNTIEETK